MPDRGDERGRGGTRTLVTGILAGTEWHPADNPQEATQTARQARDLAVRLRPVLSKLAQAPRGGRRRDLDWLPAVEQLAVDAQYFASWWLPRLEGKSAQSWPSWSADGYADWVKRLDAQRVRTLEMVQGTAPVTRIASVTQLRRGKAADQSPATEPVVENPGGDAAGDADDHGARHARGKGKSERTARIMPIRGSGTPKVQPPATFDDSDSGRFGAGDEPTHIGYEFENLNSDETHSAADEATHIGQGFEDLGTTGAGGVPTHITRSESGTFEDSAQLYDTADEPTHIGHGFEDLGTTSDEPPHTPHTPPNTGPIGFEDFDSDQQYGTGDEPTHIPQTSPNTGPIGFEDFEDLDSTADEPAHIGQGFEDVDSTADEPPHVPHTPPITGPIGFEDFDSDQHYGTGDEPTHIPHTPPNPGPGPGGLGEPIPAPIGFAEFEVPVEPPQIPRTPPFGPNNAPADSVSAPTPAPVASSGSDVFFIPHTPPNRPSVGQLSGATQPSVSQLTVDHLADDANATHMAPRTVGLGVAFAEPDEFEHFQPGSDLPPPVFPQMTPVQPVDRGRIVRYAAAAVVVAAGCVVAVVAATHKDSGATASPPRASTSSSSPSAIPPVSTLPSSSAQTGAVTAPTATDSPVAPASPPPSKPAAPPPAPPSTAAPASTAGHSVAPPSSVAPPPSSHSPVGNPGPGASGVSSLSVGSVGPDQPGSYTYTAHVHVTTRGTGSVTVTVTFGGSQSSGSAGGTGAQSQSFTLSGKTSYDLDPSVDVHGMCPNSYINAIASASGASSSVGSATSPC